MSSIIHDDVTFVPIQFDEQLHWSESIPSLFTMSTEFEINTDTDSSLSTADHTPTDHESSSTGPVLSCSHFLNTSPDVVTSTTTLATSPNGHVEGRRGHKSDTLHVLSHNDSLTTDLSDCLGISDKEKLLFCDCPPDPEIPPEVNLKEISLVVYALIM